MDYAVNVREVINGAMNANPKNRTDINTYNELCTQNMI